MQHISLCARWFLLCLGFTLLISSNSYAVLNSENTSFQATLRLISPITLTLKNDLSFADTLSGTNQVVVTAPEDNKAVKFSASGEPHASVTGSILESSIALTNNEINEENNEIYVRNFAMGGDLDSLGSGSFDENGKMANIRIGASAHVNAENAPGIYVASATFRLVYN